MVRVPIYWVKWLLEATIEYNAPVLLLYLVSKGHGPLSNSALTHLFIDIPDLNWKKRVACHIDLYNGRWPYGNGDSGHKARCGVVYQSKSDSDYHFFLHCGRF